MFLVQIACEPSVLFDIKGSIYSNKKQCICNGSISNVGIMVALYLHTRETIFL